MDDADLEQMFHTIWLGADFADRRRLQKLLSGVLAGRITMTIEEARQLSRSDVVELADALPDERPSEWIRVDRPN